MKVMQCTCRETRRTQKFWTVSKNPQLVKEEVPHSILDTAVEVVAPRGPALRKAGEIGFGGH